MRHSTGQIEPMKKTLEKVNYKINIFASLGCIPLVGKEIEQQIVAFAALSEKEE